MDASALTGEVAEVVAFSMRRPVSGGVDGRIDDDVAFIEPWGFESDTQPVSASRRR